MIKDLNRGMCKKANNFGGVERYISILFNICVALGNATEVFSHVRIILHDS